MSTWGRDSCSIGRIGHGLFDANAAIARARDAMAAQQQPDAADLVVAFGSLHNVTVEIGSEKDHAFRSLLPQLALAIEDVDAATSLRSDAAAALDERLRSAVRAIADVASHTGVSLGATCPAVVARGCCEHHAAVGIAIREHAPATLLAVLDPRVRPRHPVEATLDRKQIRTFDYGGLSADDHAAVARDARNALAAAFAPLVDDLIDGARRLRDVPLTALSMVGSEPTLICNPSVDEFEQRRMQLGLGNPGEISRLEYSVASSLRTPTGKSGLGIDIHAAIGDYGEAFSYALVQAARAVNAYAATHLDVAAGALGRRHAELLTRWTSRSKYGSDPLTILIEGVNSCCNAVALLVARRVPGLSVLELLDRIEADHSVERLAKGPSDVVGPLANHGFAPVDGLAVRDDGQVRIGAAFASVIASARAMRKVADSPTISTYGGCPLALRVDVARSGGDVRSGKTLVTLLLREYVHLARRFCEQGMPSTEGVTNPRARTA